MTRFNFNRFRASLGRIFFPAILLEFLNNDFVRINIVQLIKNNFCFFFFFFFEKMRQRENSYNCIIHYAKIARWRVIAFVNANEIFNIRKIFFVFSLCFNKTRLK